jgi:hypothetical protein
MRTLRARWACSAKVAVLHMWMFERGRWWHGYDFAFAAMMLSTFTIGTLSWSGRRLWLESTSQWLWEECTSIARYKWPFYGVGGRHLAVIGMQLSFLSNSAC